MADRAKSGSRLTELGPRIHAFRTVDEAFDELSTVHGDPDALPTPIFPTSSADTSSLGADQDTQHSVMTRVHPLRPPSPVERAGDAAENFDPDHDEAA
jgi:hypothetical protein